MTKRQTNILFNPVAMLLSFCCCFTVGIQTAQAQVGTVGFSGRETTVRQALQEVLRQTPYTVVLDWDNLDPEKSIYLPDNRLQITELLKLCLAGTGLGWDVEGDKIVVSHEKPDDGRGARSAMDGNFYDRSQLIPVRDPWSPMQVPFEHRPNTRQVTWSNDTGGKDSLGMAAINYRVNSSLVEQNYMDNARTLDRLDQALTNREVLAFMDYIVIVAGSSPEGRTVANEELADKRALAMKSYLMRKYPYLDRDMIYTFSIGEDWSGLRRMVKEDWQIPNREQVLQAIDNEPGTDAKRARLKVIGGGGAWRYISANMLPKLRGATAATIHYKPEFSGEVVIEEKIVTDTVIMEREVVVEREVIVPEIVVREPKQESHPLFAVKTNLLFDAVSALNVEIEVPIGKRWSIAGEWIFPWWLNEKKQHALEIGNGNLEVKYWLGNREGRKQMTGWFLGVYGGGGYYDIEWEDKGYQGEFWHAGFSGGYAHTIGKSGNWRMEYSLGLGYLGSKYRKYEPKLGVDNEWHLIRRNNGNYRWVGPTRAKVSLVWMFNHGTRKKGGAK